MNAPTAFITQSQQVAPRRARTDCRSFGNGRAFLASLGLAALAWVALPVLAQNVVLGTAGGFGVLSATTVTNTGATVVTGDVGVSPGTAITNFPPGIIFPGSGAFHSNDLVAQQAQSDLTAAYNDVASRACPGANNLTGQILGSGGVVPTLAPGVYCFDTTAQLTGDLILNGAGVYIFQIGTTLTTAAASSLTLTNGASACEVFWQIGSSATLGATTALAGSILAFTSISLGAGATVDGGVLARGGAVTLDNDAITACGDPVPGLTTQASPGVTIGAAISDTATLNGVLSPTGTITFDLYGPNDLTCTGPVTFTSTVPVAGSGNYPSGPFTPVVTGTYRWIANYSGDANNAATANACNGVNENVDVSQAAPSAVTTASAGVVVGGAISDTAVLSGGVNPTGTITFNLYGPNDATCTGAVIFSATVPVAGNGSYQSGPFTPLLAGTYRWIANHSGDVNNNSTANACNAANENVVVSQAAPSAVTTASAGVVVGGAISDTAVLSGGVNPTGTITFNLYGPNDATCTGAVIFSATVPVAGNGSYQSGPFTPLLAGTYRWIANHSGDVNNNSTANACNAANENVVVSQAAPSAVTTASAGVVVGGAISDTAVLSGGVNPTGTITFNLYGPNDTTCTGAMIFTATVGVAGNGSYPSGAFTPSTAGTYRWIANYSGNINNAATANVCNGLNENVVVSQAIPSVVTTASAGVVLGGAISDTAVLSGGVNPTGTIIFNLYGPNDATCTGAVIFTATFPVAGNGSYPSGPFTPATAGTYRWIANYLGDANNAATTNSCNAANENVVVSPSVTTVATQASSGVTIGAAISDTATLSGGANPTGTITFRLFGPNDATCSGAVVFTSTVPVAGNSSHPSGSFTPTTAGTYRWIGNYSGDANNLATANVCNAANETVVVGQAVPTVVTTASAAVLLGGVISDTAVLSSGVTPTGTIVFRLFGPNDATCTSAVIFTSTVSVAGNGSHPSGTFTPTTAGIYRWIANYSGDANNVATANACNAANENVVVGQAAPTVVTTASAAVPLGGLVSDTAVLSGAVIPTGTITFRLFGPNDATCTGAVIFTSTVPVAGNGSYPSGSFTPATAGTYRWIANYSGDSNNVATANACNGTNENVAVGQGLPTVVTTASAGVPLGGTISDTAVLSGGTSLTGTITFNLYGPNDATCTGAVVFTSTVVVNGNATYVSSTFTPTIAGTYRWIANYSGDTNNAATANVCNGTNENVVVGQGAPTVVTTASAGVTLGGAVSDTAVLSGSVNPTGTITFNLYGPNDAACTGALVFASTVVVNANGTHVSSSFTPTAAGTYRWIANYSGDANNAATANGCNAANESVAVTAVLLITEIPTVSDAGLLLLAMLLGVSGLFAVRREPKTRNGIRY